jgi:hypothetical protein
MYWQLGHSFDTIIDYFVFVDESEAAAVPKLLSTPTSARSRMRAGMTTVVVVGHRGTQGRAACRAVRRCATVRDEVHRVLEHDARSGDEGLEELVSSSVGAAFPGGVWNCDWWGKDACGDCNTLPPEPPTECGPGGQGDSRNHRGIQTR